MKCTRRNFGYTLIEVLISLGVFAMLSSIVYANFKYGNSAQNLTQAQKEFIQTVRSAQNLALTGTVPDSLGALPYGYGVVYEYPAGTQALIFATTAERVTYNAITDTIIQTVPMKTAVTLETCEPQGQAIPESCTPQAPCTCNIFFTSGDAIASITNGVGNPQTSIQTKLQNVATDRQKTVNINTQSGTIEVGP